MYAQCVRACIRAYVCVCVCVCALASQALVCMCNWHSHVHLKICICMQVCVCARMCEPYNSYVESQAALALDLFHSQGVTNVLKKGNLITA